MIGLPKNARLIRALGKELYEASELCRQTGQAARAFKDFRYRTKTSWSCERRVIGKAEHLPKGANPRFVVTSLLRRRHGDRELRPGPVSRVDENRRRSGTGLELCRAVSRLPPC